MSTPPTIAHVLRRRGSSEYPCRMLGNGGHVRGEEVRERLAHLVVHDQDRRDVVIEEHAWSGAGCQRVKACDLRVDGPGMPVEVCATCVPSLLSSCAPFERSRSKLVALY